jgi:nucleoside-diphosphate-sugar epimerase
MKVVVFGGNGFIGRYVVEKLHAEGHEVVSADNLSTGGDLPEREGVRCVQMDITRRAEFDLIEMKPDRVIHLAFPTALCDRSPQNQFLDVFTQGTINVLEYTKETCNKLVFGSSISVYGISGETAISEKSEVNPLLIYGCNKHVNELYVRAYNQTCGLEFNILRISDTFGPFDRRRNAINNFIDSFINNKQLSVNGNGEQKRSFTYVEDMAEAIVKATTSLNNRTYNVAAAFPVSVNQLIQALEDIFGFSPGVIYREQNMDLRDYVFDCSLFRQDFGDFEHTGFWEGLQNMVEFKRNKA